MASRSAIEAINAEFCALTILRQKGSITTNLAGSDTQDYTQFDGGTMDMLLNTNMSD